MPEPNKLKAWQVVGVLAALVAFIGVLWGMGAGVTHDRKVTRTELETAMSQALTDSYNKGWMAGREYGYYHSFIDVLYGCNEYGAIEESGTTTIYKRLTTIKTPKK